MNKVDEAGHSGSIPQATVNILLPLAVVLFSLLLACGPNYVNVWNEPKVDLPVLQLKVAPIDSLYTLHEINGYLQLYDRVYSMPRRTATFDSLLDSLTRMRKPAVRVEITNMSDHPLVTACGSLSIYVMRGGQHNANILFTVGNQQGPLTPVRLPPNVVSTADRDPMPFYDAPGHFREVLPGETAVLFDSLDFLIRSGLESLEAGSHWMTLSYQNYFIDKGHSEYWTGRLNSDTLWFRIAE